MSLAALVHKMAQDAKNAARQVAVLPTTVKNQALAAIAEGLLQQRGLIEQENQKDIAVAREQGHLAAFIDRLTLSDKAIKAMIQGLNDVIHLPDPVGAVSSMWR